MRWYLGKRLSRRWSAELEFYARTCIVHWGKMTERVTLGRGHDLDLNLASYSFCVPDSVFYCLLTALDFILRFPKTVDPLRSLSYRNSNVSNSR